MPLKLNPLQGGEVMPTLSYNLLFLREAADSKETLFGFLVINLFPCVFKAHMCLAD